MGSTSPFKSGVQSGGLLGFTAPAQKSGDNCGDLCTAAVLIVSLPRLRGPSDSHSGPSHLIAQIMKHFIWGCAWWPLRRFNWFRIQWCGQWWACLQMPLWHPCSTSCTGYQFVSKCRLSPQILTWHKVWLPNWPPTSHGCLLGHYELTDWSISAIWNHGLAIPSISMQEMCFFVMAPAFWNEIPSEICGAPILMKFQMALKTWLWVRVDGTPCWNVFVCIFILSCWIPLFCIAFLSCCYESPKLCSESGGT